MSTDRKMERERIAREWLIEHVGWPTTAYVIAPLASLLERVETQAHTEGHESAYVSEIVPCPDCPPGGPYAELCDDCGGSGKDVHLMSPNDAEDRIMKLSDDLTEARERIRQAKLDEARALAAALREAAQAVMAKLEQYGPAIVPHLLDTDDNDGQRLRGALLRAAGEGK